MTELKHTGSCLALLVALACSLAAPGAAAAAAAGTTALDGYLSGLTTWSAQFTQSAVDSKGKRVAESDASGRFLIVRPGRFRWESAPKEDPQAVTLTIADGRNLWIYDQDLEQATVKRMRDELPQSPALLLAGDASLRDAFEVTSSGRRDGLDWVRARPKDAESDFREAQFGFRGRELARLVVVDKLGQRATLVFTGVRRNVAVDPKLVQFEPPPGVDVIGTPVAP
jgi:outer membrane lipoprotein carrier protein